MMRFVPFLILLAQPAFAEGFAIKDLSGLPTDGTLVGGGAYIGRAEPERLTLTCPDCKGAPMVDVLLGRQDDGTEARVRSGKTTMAELEGLCQARAPDCTLDGLDVAPAVGWVTRYATAAGAGSTVVILRDGDLLTLRVLSRDPDVASALAKKLVKRLVPVVVGD